MQKKVSVISCDDYIQEKIDNAVKKAIQSIDFKIKPNSKILIKPNLVSTNTPNQHSVTHYTVIDALCKLFKEKKCDITIGESSAFYQRGYTNKAYETSKIDKVAEKYGAKLIEFENESIKKVKGKLDFLDELALPDLSRFDLIVDVPKIKTHMLMRFTGALKNLYGIVPGGYKQYHHTKTRNINEMANVFLDIYQNIKPKMLCIMDAVIGLDGGPAAVIGKPKKVGYILASEDPNALDIVACKIIGYSPTDLPIINMAIKRGMIKLSDINQVGNFNQVIFEKLQKGEIKDYEKQSLLITETHTWPTVSRKCNNCQICIKYCPFKAISEKNGKAFIDKTKCVFCYTCIPKCPVKAIYHKSTLKNKFIRFVRFLLRI